MWIIFVLRAFTSPTEVLCKFHVNEFELCSVAKYFEDVRCFLGNNNTSKNLTHSGGVKVDCILNHISCFHAVQN